MASKTNKLHMQLAISENDKNTFDYQYYSVLENGVVVKVEGFIIDTPSEFHIKLTASTKKKFFIKECLIPGHQSVVKVEKLKQHSVILIDKDNESAPEDYNFIIIACEKSTGRQVICDPQIKNRGKVDP